MELWIRSQDRLRLARMDSVIINARNKKEITSNYSYTSDGFEKDIPLGEYKTEERALEVLDEIQNIIIGKYMCDINLEEAFSKIENEEDIAKLLKQMAVYEMPKE